MELDIPRMADVEKIKPHCLYPARVTGIPKTIQHNLGWRQGYTMDKFIPVYHGTNTERQTTVWIDTDRQFSRQSSKR